MLVRFYAQYNARPDMLFLVTLAPLWLFVFGIDYFRWTQLIFVSIFGVFLLKSHAGLRVFRFGKLEKIILGLYMLSLGPIGINYMGPVLRRIVGLS